MSKPSLILAMTLTLCLRICNAHVILAILFEHLLQIMNQAKYSWGLNAVCIASTPFTAPIPRMTQISVPRIALHAITGFGRLTNLHLIQPSHTSPVRPTFATRGQWIKSLNLRKTSSLSHIDPRGWRATTLNCFSARRLRLYWFDCSPFWTEILVLTTSL